MRKLLSLFVFTASLTFAQYKLDTAGAPPSEAAAAADKLQADGYKIVAGNGSAFAEVWFVKTAPSGPKNTEEGISLPTIPSGAFLGVMRFPAQGADRRGQPIKAGVYILRYSLQPVNGDHLGVAPQRDFLLLTPIADDKEVGKNLSYDETVALSKKASGTPHPAVLSMSAGSGAKFPSLAKEGDTDWVLTAKIGDLPVALIVVGKVEG